MSTRKPRRGPVFAAAALSAALLASSPPAARATAGTGNAAVAHAGLIRSETNARYGSAVRPRLAVTEATTTGVVESLTLLEPAAGVMREVAAERGVYYAICTAPAKCPHLGLGGAWRRGAFLPRRQAVELALRTFAETAATLVVVSLPTRRPLWVVFERDRAQPWNAPELAAALDGRPRAASPQLRRLVFSVTRPRLYEPIPLLPPPRDTIFAVQAAPLVP